MTVMFGHAAKGPSRSPLLVALSPGIALPLACALFVAIFLLRFLTDNAADAVEVLYVLPVGLMAASLGTFAGIGSGLGGLALIAFWAVLTHPLLDPLGWVARAAALLLLGGLLGATADSLRSNQRRFEATLDSMLDPFMVLEPVVDLDGRLVDVRPVYANATARAGGDGERSRILIHPVTGVGGRVSAALVDGFRLTYESRHPLVLNGFEVAPAGPGRSRLYDVRAFCVDDMLACTWRDVTDQRELQKAMLARREAGEINDSIVQRLAVAKWMLEAGDTDKGLAMVGDTMEVAQRLVTQLLGADISSGALLPAASSKS